jgi:nucleoside-diphosphate-sugar epimerase
MADQAQAGNDILIFGSHDAKRNYIHLSDLTEVINRVVQGRHVGLFTCMHQQNIRVSDMACAAYSAFKTKGQVRFDSDKPDLPDLAEIDDYLLYQRIDFWPAIDIYEGYRRIKLHRENNS